jgi:mono/diheme cytochrome c family protein
VRRGRANPSLAIGAGTNMQNVCVRAAIFLVLVGLLFVCRVRAEDAAAEGEQIYEDYCSTCHGEQLQNNSNGLTFDLRRLKSDEYPRFVNSVTNGKNKMPPWKGVLTETQINDLWAYIRATISP